VERAFAFAFPLALEPVQIARKLVAAFEAGANPPGRAGRRFIVNLHESDFSRLAADLPYFERQWSAMLARLAERSGQPQMAPEVRAQTSPGVAAGTATIAVETLPEPPSLALRVRRGLPPGARVALSDRTIVVGREPDCDLVLADPRASRRHLEIFPAGAVHRLRDLGSSNGTRLNGVPVTEAELGLGDVVLLGDSELAVEPGEGAPA
jgi:pSer/pThr/pTyr-binding forkhead associated (FHA) protein